MTLQTATYQQTHTCLAASITDQNNSDLQITRNLPANDLRKSWQYNALRPNYPIQGNPDTIETGSIFRGE
jgi:hypothetical protein